MTSSGFLRSGAFERGQGHLIAALERFQLTQSRWFTSAVKRAGGRAGSTNDHVENPGCFAQEAFSFGDVRAKGKDLHVWTSIHGVCQGLSLCATTRHFMHEFDGGTFEIKNGRQ